MDLNFTSEELAFRDEVRAFLREQLPSDIAQRIKSGLSIRAEDYTRWQKLLHARGWGAPTWPKQFGGTGWSPVQLHIFDEESAAAGAPRSIPFGLKMVGPVIMAFGSGAQQQRWLPGIVNGEDWWCQGYSEPGAGSDLASLKMRAERHVDKGGDHYIVNGQKTWNTLGQYADWIFCLVRTDFSAKKQEGISFVLFDMQSPGISTSPIRLISGYSPFTQTFFDNVQVPKENLVGELNKGWTIAKYLLTHERNMIGGIGTQRQTPLSQLAIKSIGLASGKLAEGTLRADIARFEMDAQAFALTMGRVMDEAKAGSETGAVSSMLKYYGTELNKRRAELAMSISGTDGLKFDGQAQADIAPVWLRTKANSIEGGTSEVQLNIIAKNVLRLPGA